MTVLGPEAALIRAPLLALNASGYAPGTRAQVLAGGATLATDYVAARRLQFDLPSRVAALFQEVDILLAPSVPFVAPHEDPVIVDDQDSEILSSGIANVTGHPSISLPCGWIKVLPVGVQLPGPLGHDTRPLSVAKHIAGVLNRRLDPVLVYINVQFHGREVMHAELKADDRHVPDTGRNVRLTGIGRTEVARSASMEGSESPNMGRHSGRAAEEACEQTFAEWKRQGRSGNYSNDPRCF